MFHLWTSGPLEKSQPPRHRKKDFSILQKAEAFLLLTRSIQSQTLTASYQETDDNNWSIWLSRPGLTFLSTPTSSSKSGGKLKSNKYYCTQSFFVFFKLISLCHKYRCNTDGVEFYKVQMFGIRGGDFSEVLHLTQSRFSPNFGQRLHM